MSLTAFTRPSANSISIREAGLMAAASRKGLGAGGDNSAFDELKKRGVEVQMLTAAEKAEFAKATRAVYDKWVPTVGADLVKMAEGAIARRG